jgi:hypothetical protein
MGHPAGYRQRGGLLPESQTERLEDQVAEGAPGCRWHP